VGYFDGTSYKIVAEDIAYANGINLDHSRDILFVASPRHSKVIVYDIQDDGSLKKEDEIPCGSGVDNIEFDENGSLWIGSHPNGLATIPYFEGDNEFSPSEIVVVNYKKKGEHEVHSIYESDGKDMSASTVAIPYKDRVYVGNVMDDHFISLERTKVKK